MTPIQFYRKALNYLDLTTELEDFDRIDEEIMKGIVFKGTNLWILVFAIIVASVGLNTNSTAVIIGAMLISPLMGPINGIGYSVATYNFVLFRQSVKNFSFAVGASLFASTTYFALSPISTAHSELLARTSPSIYDVMIALFGGMAGIIAISSRQKGNVIPGVAIATALMPPLCTAGYGLATAQYDFFFGALYLFTINTVFIALASMGISHVLKFPMRTVVGSAQKKKLNSIISVVTVAVLLPSIYFGYKLVQVERFRENANKYINNVSTFEGNYLLKSQIDDKHRAIELVYGGLNLSEVQKELIIEKADGFNLDRKQIFIKQGLALGMQSNESIEVMRLREELYRSSVELKDSKMVIDSLRLKSSVGKAILEEIQYFMPEIAGCVYAETNEYVIGQKKAKKIAVVLFSTKGKPLNADNKERISRWLGARVSRDDIKIIYQ